VLDEKLNVSIQTTQDYDAMSLWKKLIDSKYVRDILESPSKTYMTRLRNEGNIYDFAAVARLHFSIDKPNNFDSLVLTTFVPSLITTLPSILKGSS